ncbi:hypothetical protein G4D82_01090 [Flavobacterium sp. CYK-4]|uniref:hypothetical protein n=1 Tax=Flavobacterium lotistagni TaxID=2709660 RepID=UPI00140CA009|nr:hypothetical protein [Flavobacterium lotistagni]NHM05803.1 hypothetical protein [Flavobacterium lotistagni]
MALKKILPLFSYLFHPILIPLFGTLLYLFGYDNGFAGLAKFLILAQVVLITILLPITLLYFLKITGKADSMMLPDINQRKIPLLIQLVLVGILLSRSFTTDNVPELFYFFLGGMMSTTLALLLVFLKFKASLHMIGISALTAFVIGMSIHHFDHALLEISGLFIVSGLVGSSRLQMKAHSGIELAIGYAIGFVPQLALWVFWL